MGKKIFLSEIQLNVQKEMKNIFILNYLIPALEEIRDCEEEIELFIQRTINKGPVIFVYYKNIKCPGSPEFINTKLVKVLSDFLNDHRNSLIENDIYFKHSKSLATMNGKSNIDSYENYSVKFKEMERLKREGEYSHVEEEEKFNNWFFSNGRLIEETIKILSNYDDDEKHQFITSLFLITSRQLNGEDLDGYLSFKSHYIGFIASNESKMMSYHNSFLNRYSKKKEMNKYEVDHDMGYHLQMDDMRMTLIRKWYKEIKSFVEEMKKQNKFTGGLSTVFRMLQFRTVSTFHKEAFKLSKLKYYLSNEFQRYRKLVNLLYLLLPTLGFNTVDRLYCALALIKVVEEDIYNVQIQG